MPTTRRRFLHTATAGSAVLALSVAQRIHAASKPLPAEGSRVNVPDLQDGFMIINHDGVIDKKLNENRWYTPVECVLSRKTAGQSQDQRAYLCHECRAELVGEDPFGHQGNYEWVGLSAWDGNYAIRSGPGHANQPRQQYGKMRFSPFRCGSE